MYNRSRPRRKNSIQAKRHLGLGLFCSKKPPKTADNENELAHYQRSHKKNIVNQFYHPERKDQHKHVLEVSMDDKAYLCPSTSTGMRGARNQTIFQTCDEERSRKLPKYDFPIPMVNVVPSTYRFMSKEIKEIDQKKETQITNDSCSVFFRPKYFLGSSGTVWASEFMSLRHKEPHQFEAVESNSHEGTQDFKTVTISLHDSLSYYIDSSEEEDLSNCNKGEDYCNYQILRITGLQKAIWMAYEKISQNQMTETEAVKLDGLKANIDKLHQLLINLKDLIEKKRFEETLHAEHEIVESARELLESILLLASPQKSHFLEWTDAGPGVGITNFDVRFRIGQRIRIMDADYFVRHHLSNGDSAQNEVERCQSYIGDAICDGASLEWEYKKLDEREMELLEKLPYKKIEEFELKRMEFNANKVCIICFFQSPSYYIRSSCSMGRTIVSIK